MKLVTAYGIASMGAIVAQAAFLDFPLSRHILVRQSSVLNPPPQCKSDCDPVASVVNGAKCTPQTCCTAQFENHFFKCIPCVAGPDIDFTTFQQILDQVVMECSAVGISLPKLTFPGQDPSRPLSTIPAVSSTTTRGTASSIVSTTRSASTNPPTLTNFPASTSSPASTNSPVSISSPVFTRTTLTEGPTFTSTNVSTSAPISTNSAASTSTSDVSWSGVAIMVVNSVLAAWYLLS